MYVLGILLWVAVVAWLALRLTRNFKSPIVRAAVVMVSVPLSFVLALADEIVGKYQFDRLCEEAKEVSIHATHPVGEELYTPEGKWRVGNTLEERNRLEMAFNSLIRFGEQPRFPEEVPAVVPIWKYDQRIYDSTDGRLLAEWTKYGRSGGWLSRNGFLGESSRQCEPEIVTQGNLKLSILPFMPKERK